MLIFKEKAKPSLARKASPAGGNRELIQILKIRIHPLIDHEGVHDAALVQRYSDFQFPPPWVPRGKMARSEVRKLKAQSTVLKGVFANGLTEARNLLKAGRFKMIEDCF